MRPIPGDRDMIALGLEIVKNLPGDFMQLRLRTTVVKGKSYLNPTCVAFSI